MSLKHEQGWSSVQKQISNDLNKLNHRKIEFELTSNTGNINVSNVQNNQLQRMAAKSTKNESNNANQPTNVELSQKREDIGLFDPTVIPLHLSWSKISAVGPGFYNDGNSCYLNSTLQCLVHTAPLAQILLYDFKNAATNNLAHIQHEDHKTKPILHIFYNLIGQVWKSRESVIAPRGMQTTIRRVGSQFKPFRQEDAHEYLRQLLDKMHEEILDANRIKIKDGRIAETSVISRIFGGYIRNTVSCPKCNYVSQTHNHFQDLSLEIPKGIDSIDAAIAAFIKPENLTNGNEWKCEKCNLKVKAKKQMTLSQLPNVLVLHLKRFSYGNMFGKITKQICFKKHLLVPCSSEGNKKVTYELFGLVVHHGSSSHSGHYVAYVKAANGNWYEMNDSKVTEVSLKSVLSKQAYILFYSKMVLPTAVVPVKSKESMDVNVANKNINKPEIVGKQSLVNDDVGEIITFTDLVTVNGAAKDHAIELNDSLTENNSVFNLSKKPNRLAARRYDELWYFLPFRWRGGRLNDIFRWSWSGKRKLYDFLHDHNVDRKLRFKKENKTTIEEGRNDSDDSSSSDNSSSENDSIKDHNNNKVIKNMNESDNDGEYTNIDDLKTINDVDKTVSSESINPTTMLRSMINYSNRGKEVGGEGVWETVPNHIIAKVKEQTTQQLRLEQKNRQSKQQDSWNELLDQGRTKKVKLKNDENVQNINNQSENYFQKVQDDRINSPNNNTQNSNYFGGRSSNRGGGRSGDGRGRGRDVRGGRGRSNGRSNN
eukprot:gene6907-9459_t